MSKHSKQHPQPHNKKPESLMDRPNKDADYRPILKKKSANPLHREDFNSLLRAAVKKNEPKD